MATKYWVALQGTATVPTANTASNWNSAADGSGSSGVPATTDDCVFGHADTVAAQLGFAECNWDLTQVNSITVHEGYQYQTTVTSDQITFTSASREITHATDNFESLGFKVGMWITITGSTLNNGTHQIISLVNNVIGTSSALTDETKGASVSIVSESSIDIQATTLTINTLSLNGTIKNSTGSNKTLRFEGTPGTNNWYITNDANAQVLNQDDLTYQFNSAQTISFDDGEYPQVTVTAAANLQWDYKADPTSDVHKAVSFYSLNVSNSSATAAGTLSDPRNDFKKVFKVLTTGFSFTPSRFDAGFSTWHFKMSGNFGFPVTGSTAYGAGDGSFTAAWYNVVLDEPDTAGRICDIGAGRTLNVNSLTVESGAQFQGYSTKGGDTTSTVVCINRPTINGAWNFSQVAEGIYSSVVTDTYPFTPSHGAAGNIQISDYGGKFLSDDKLTWTTSSSTLTVDGKLTVTGLIDPTGMVFTPQAVNPESTNPQDTIWVSNEDGHLYRGDRDVESTVHFNVRNDEGATIPLGAPLYSKGEIGGSNRIKVGIADASDPNKMPAIGLAMEEMNTTSTKDGNMILTGIFNKNITITGVNEQDIIYVAPHGGSAPYLTITRPTSSSHLVQNVGVCVRQSATNVSQGMKVAAIGRTNDSPNCSFLMVNTESTHPQARRLVAGTNITLTDGGAGGDLTIAASGGGGGGSGTVTSVAVSGSDGIEVDSGSPITTSGTIALGVDAPTLRSHINVEDGADVTDATNVASAGAIMDSDFSANGLMERTGSGSYTVNTDIIQTEHLAIDYATGWWTFAVVKGWDALGGSSSQRAMSQFYIQDKRSSRHRTARIEASHQFGVDGSNSLTCFAVSGYGNEIPFTEFRIKEGSTYDGAALQIYISNSLNDLSLHMIFNLGTGDGWTLLSTMLADSDTAGHDALLGDTSRTYVDFATSMTVKKTLDIEEIGFVDANSGGGIATTGGLVVQGSARVAGTFRQGVTNAVLVADANGDLTAASTLADVAYLQAGQAETDIFTPTISAPSWAAPPPANIQEAIERLANALAPLVGGIIP